MTDCMIDLETLDNRSSSAIVSIGACLFDRTTGEIMDTFYERISWTAALASGGTVGASTLKWWFKQSDEARLELTKGGGIKISVAMNKLAGFIPYMSRVWGNGSSFDISILEHTMGRCSVKIPWAHWNVRDVRTVCDLATMKREDVPFEGEKHNALDDAIHQAQYVSLMIQELTSGSLINES